MPKREICLFACCLLLPAVIASQDQPRIVEKKVADVSAVKTSGDFSAGAFELKFPGSVALRREIDSMTDKPFCFASVESDMVGIDVAGKSAANLGTPSDIDYEKPAMLRIDNDPPIPLNIQHQKHQFLFRGTATRQLQIPQERVEEFVRALYTRRRVRLRYATFPGPGNYDADVKFGDFAAAYDRGTQLCAWPSISAAAAHPTAEEIAALMFPGTTDAPASNDFFPHPSAETKALCLLCPSLEFEGPRYGSKHQGTVSLRATISPAGLATGIYVVSGPGLGLEEKAIKAVEYWRFKPALGANGHPVAVTIPIEVSFE